MNRQKLTELSIDELKQKKQTLKMVLNIFLGVLLILIGVLIFMVIRNGITPLIAVPFALLPVYLLSQKNIKTINTEIESRKQ